MVTAKMWVSFAGSVITALSAAFADDVFDVNDGTQVALTVVSALGAMWAVWRVPNTTV